jgi:type III secretion protein W
MADIGDKIPLIRVQGIQSDQLRAQKAGAAESLSMYAISQESAAEEFTEWTELAAFNPLALARRFESLEVKARRKGREDEPEKTKEKQVLEIKRLEEVSDQFQRKNPELQQRSLLALRQRISKSSSKEDVLKAVLETYPDYALADEALEFLLETSGGELHAMIQAAKEELNAKHAKEVRAGRNIGAKSREFSKQGLGTPTALRDMYRDITDNPRDPTTLFDELSAKFPFEKMKTVIEFILHSLGADLKSKGPSIARAELHRLLTETRSLQAILGVYRFFKTRMNLINSAFVRSGLTIPMRLTFELLSKNFVKFLQERYPTADKALMLASQFDTGEDLHAQMILLMQLRDAIRGVAPKLFKSQQHRQDVLETFIEALEKIEEELEEEEEKEEEQEE